MEIRPRLPRDDVNVSSEHPVAEGTRLAVAVGIGAFALVLLAFGAVELLVRFVPASFEARAFGGWFDALAEGGEDDPRLAASRALLERLAAHWAENPYALRLGVAEESQPNAFALPGGAILLTSGLLEQVESENELAFVLAHEIGHFRNRDHLEGLGRGLVLSLVVGGLAGDALPTALSGLAESRYARDDERDADAFALELVQAEFGHVAGADRFFRRLPDAESEGGVGAWVSTHPVSRERIEAIDALARERGWSRSGALAPLPEPDPPLEPGHREAP